jgi:hypothetical protein
MALSVLRGFIGHKTIDGIDCTVVSKIYCKGEIVTDPVNCDTLKDDTYLISGVGINGIVVEFSAYKVEKKYGRLRLYKVNLQDIYRVDNLHNAMCEVSTMYHGLL